MLHTRKYSKGFTLLEILLVVAIISVLAGIVIVAINPAKQLGDARNAQRRADVATILSAVYQYIIDHSGTVPATINTFGSFTSASTTCDDIITNANGSDYEICKSNVNTCGQTDLEAYIASTTGSVSYLTAIPTDPSVDLTAEGSGYYIARIPNSGNRIIVCASTTENFVEAVGRINASR
jgi:type IV pilus assembly protein PilA